ncbi:MAG: acyltransferase [Desulfamplus sp.]|nr:acyltransferase [Desulfamplus sp.]
MGLAFSKQRSHAFDLYRCIAVLAVVIGHIGLYMESIDGLPKLFFVTPINYGVPLFFIISGYLLAGSISSLRAIAQTTYLQSLKRFYYLRVCRIYPAYIFWLFIIWGLSNNILSLSSNMLNFNSNIEGTNIFVQIMDLVTHIFNIHNIFPQYCRTINPVFWTLAVEFQWYLLAPALFYLMLDKSNRNMLITFFIILIISICSRNWIIWSYFAEKIPIAELWRLSNEQIYVELYSFALGIIIWRFRRTEWRLSNMGMILIWAGFLLIAFYTYSFYFAIGSNSNNVIGIERLNAREGYIQFMVITNMKYISQIILAYIVFHYRNISLPKIFYLPVQYIATISYSMYIIHYPIMNNFFSPSQNFISAFISYLFITFAVSTLSYMFIEKPFIAKSRRESFTNTKTI